MTGNMGERAEDFPLEPAPVGDERLEQSPVGVAVATERLGGVVDRPIGEDCGSVVEWMSERGRRIDELEV
jgi:hypothetical protein